MNAPEMSPSNPHPPEDDTGELVSELDEMIASSDAPADTAAPSGGVPAPESDGAPDPEPSPLDDIPNPEETLAGLDDMLAEAAEKAEVTLSPLDEPEDVDPFGEIDEVDIETEAETEAEAETDADADPGADAVAGGAPATEEGGEGDDPEASSIPESMDDGEIADSATELAREMEETLHGKPEEDSLYDDDPDETDAPEVYGPGDAFGGAEPEGEASSEPDAEADAERGAVASAPDADAPGAVEEASEPLVEAKPERASPVGKVLGALAPVAKAGGPLKGVSISLANVLSLPLSRLSPERRDLVGYAAVTLLFNALCLIVVLLFM